MHWDQKQFKADQEEQERLKYSNLDSDEPLEEAPDKFIGTTLSDRYEIIELAGKGGMSAVYRARHLLTQKTVALKLMHSYLLTDNQAVRRFHQEAKAASRLQHPNAISVQDLGVTDDGQPYLVMDYLEGWSLSEVIKLAGKIDVDRALHIFSQACGALAHAHENSIIHRDLKPSNIMLIRSDEDSDFVKVVDFGIAKIMPEGGEGLKLTTTGEVFGSPLYMSPEQCNGQPLDQRSDIYSMGCLMYEALTGKPPLEGNNILETMHKQMHESPAVLSGLDAHPRLVQQLDKIIQKCMAKSREQRYSSMTELKDDLQNASESKKGSKLAATIGLGATKHQRALDNKIAGFSSKKVFWTFMPLSMMLLMIICGVGYAWTTISADPEMSNRDLPLDMQFNIVVADPEKLAKLQGERVYIEHAQKHMFSSPEEKFYGMVKMADALKKAGLYNDAVDVYGAAAMTANNGGFAEGIQTDIAEINAKVAQCLLAQGKLNNAYNYALVAYINFQKLHVETNSNVAPNLGTLLEICSQQPDKLPQGANFFNSLHKLVLNIYKVAKAPALTQAVIYLQAADYLIAAGNGAYWSDQPANIPTLKLALDYLQRSLDAWKVAESMGVYKDMMMYNEAVILNKMGLVLAKTGDLEAAELKFKQALQKIQDTTTYKDAALPKVLFNLSDVQFKERKIQDYIDNHGNGVAKRIWAKVNSLDKHVSH